MNSFEFLHNGLSGNATLTVRDVDGSTSKIASLQMIAIERHCPLLAHAFELGRHGFRHDMEDVSFEAVIALLRYAYTRSYLPKDWEHPVSLLLHLEIYRLAHIYDVPELQLQVRGRILWECEMSCSVPAPPTGLSEGIRYLYDQLSSQTAIKDTMLNYCVECLFTHSLDTNRDFIRLVYEHIPFHQDLCQINISRCFKDSAAFAIIRLPMNTKPKDTTVRLEDKVLGDYLYEIWNEPATPLLRPIRTVSPGMSSSDPSNTSLSTPLDISLDDSLGTPLGIPRSYTLPFRRGGPLRSPLGSTSVHSLDSPLDSPLGSETFVLLDNEQSSPDAISDSETDGYFVVHPESGRSRTT